LLIVVEEVRENVDRIIDYSCSFLFYLLKKCESESLNFTVEMFHEQFDDEDEDYDMKQTTTAKERKR
jgi:hypothetical protein